MGNSIVAGKSKRFAVRIVNLYKHLCSVKKEFVLSKQILRSGTSIGANVHEAIQAQSRKDFTSKLSIALKEASETEYWLDLLYETEFITRDEYRSIAEDCSELCKLLISIIKTTKES
jgi:four helix bundle protein